MRDLESRRRFRKILYSRAALVALAVVAALSLNAVYNVYGKYREAEANLEHTEKELASLLKRKEILEDNIEQLGTSAGVEREIREKFGLAKEGESIIIIIDEEAGSGAPTGEESSFWERVKDMVGI